MTEYSVADAKNKLPKLIDRALGGEEVVITRRGKPVAVIGPYSARLSQEREQAIERLVELMRVGLPLGGRRFSRDEMHER